MSIRKKYPLKIIFVIIVIILIIALWLITWYIGSSMDYTDRGTFGDMFGSTNALYSGLALTGIIITILLQREDLKSTREELQETRREFKIQNKTLQYQRFETTLFSLLSLHQKIVEGLYLSVDNQISVIGRNVFREIYTKLKDKDKEIILFDNNKCDLEHYFRNIYRIIKFIDITKFDEETKKENEEIKYQNVKFLREQLSTYELNLIFYWGILEKGKKLKPYIEKYTFLKNISQSFKDHSIKNKSYDNQAFIVKKEYRN